MHRCSAKKLNRIYSEAGSNKSFISTPRRRPRPSPMCRQACLMFVRPSAPLKCTIPPPRILVVRIGLPQTGQGRGLRFFRLVSFSEALTIVARACAVRPEGVRRLCSRRLNRLMTISILAIVVTELLVVSKSFRAIRARSVALWCRSQLEAFCDTWVAWCFGIDFPDFGCPVF